MRRIKLAIILPSLNGGGAQRVALNLLRYMDRQRFELVLIALKGDGPYIKDIPEDISFIDLETGRARYAFAKLRKTLRKINPDIIFSTLVQTNMLLLLMRPFICRKAILMIRESNTPSMMVRKLKGGIKLIISLLYHLLYRTADGIVAQCEDMKADIIQQTHVRTAKVSTIYNPVNIEAIDGQKQAFNPYNDGSYHIVSAGRLTEQKGYDILIKAMGIVCNEIKDARLHILGTGPLKDSLVDLSKEYGVADKVIFEGFQDNPYVYFYHSDLFVLSSRWEGFPNALLEAMACDAPVICTDILSGPREILLSKEMGYLVKEVTPEAVAEAILEIAKGKAQTDKGRKRAEDFDVRRIVKVYEQLFIECFEDY